jgi:hypothetical protein
LKKKVEPYYQRDLYFFIIDITDLNFFFVAVVFGGQVPAHAWVFFVRPQALPHHQGFLPRDHGFFPGAGPQQHPS